MDSAAGEQKQGVKRQWGELLQDLQQLVLRCDGALQRACRLPDYFRAGFAERGTGTRTAPAAGGGPAALTSSLKPGPCQEPQEGEHTDCGDVATLRTVVRMWFSLQLRVWRKKERDFHLAMKERQEQVHGLNEILLLKEQLGTKDAMLSEQESSKDSSRLPWRIVGRHRMNWCPCKEAASGNSGRRKVQRGGLVKGHLAKRVAVGSLKRCTL